MVELAALEQATASATTAGNDGVGPGHAPNQTKSPEAHAAVRLAKAVVPIVHAPRDPRTIAGWGRQIAASQGAIRTWCYTAGVSPRRSLLFARMLRVVYCRQSAHHRPENLLDVVDRRTVAGLLRTAGFAGEHDLPTDLRVFLSRQTLISDPVALAEIGRALDAIDAWRRTECASAESIAVAGP